MISCWRNSVVIQQLTGRAKSCMHLKNWIYLLILECDVGDLMKKIKSFISYMYIMGSILKVTKWDSIICWMKVIENKFSHSFLYTFKGINDWLMLRPPNMRTIQKLRAYETDFLVIVGQPTVWQASSYKTLQCFTRYYDYRVYPRKGPVILTLLDV